MTIAIFSDCYTPSKNGVVTVILQLKDSLQKLGHKVIIVTVKPTTPYQEEENVIRVPSIPAGLGMTDQYFAITTSKHVLRELKSQKIDIIHVHSEFVMGLTGLRVAKKLKIPAVFTTHTLWEDFYEFYLPMGKFIPVKVIRQCLKLYVKRFYALINVSYKAYKYFHEDFMVPQKPSAIIPNSIEPSKFCKEKASKWEFGSLKRKYGIKNSDKILLFIGRIGEEKRVFELLEVCKQVVSQTKNVKVLFVGNGPALDEMQKNSELEIKKGRIIYTGFINWFEVHKFYEMADLFVTTSLSEMHSMTILEGLLSGLPIVARNDLSLVDTVHNGENGILVENETEMVGTILSLINDDKKLQEFSKRSLEISKTFSPDIFALKHEAFYREVIKKFPSPISEKHLREIVEKIE